LNRPVLAIAMLLSVGSAYAQVGRYSEDELRQHKQQVEQARARQAAQCASNRAEDKASEACSHYARAIQPPAATRPAPEAGAVAHPQPDGVLFPGATRVAPGLQATKSGGKTLKAIIASYQAKQYPEAIAQAEALGAAATSNAYERSFAYQLAGNAAADAGDKQRAVSDFQHALDSNGLDNDAHYQVMFNLAVLQYQAGHPDKALATLDRLTGETHADAPSYMKVRAGALADLHRPAEAAQQFEQLHAADPDDTQALMNAAAAWQQAKQPAKANALLAAARQKGAMTTAAQYRALYAGYLNDDQPKQALAVIDEGVAKGVITPSPDLAQAYSVIAQQAYDGGDAATAIALYGKAAPMAADGRAALNLASVLWNEKRMSEAKAAAQLALQKGLDAAHAAEARKLAGIGGT
jgi:predicted negative regulator of RcsB-dependent stress response